MDQRDSVPAISIEHMVPRTNVTRRKARKRGSMSNKMIARLIRVRSRTSCNTEGVIRHTSPDPRQVGHTVCVWKAPRGVLVAWITTPCPPHCPHVFDFEPGFTPLPSHVLQPSRWRMRTFRQGDDGEQKFVTRLKREQQYDNEIQSTVRDAGSRTHWQPRKQLTAENVSATSKTMPSGDYATS